MLIRLCEVLNNYGNQVSGGTTYAARVEQIKSYSEYLLLDGKITEDDLRYSLAHYRDAPFWKRWFLF